MLTAGRIQIFNGMSGTLTIKAGIGVLGSNFGATVTLFSGSVSGHYQDFLLIAAIYLSAILLMAVFVLKF